MRKYSYLRQNQAKISINLILLTKIILVVENIGGLFFSVKNWKFLVLKGKVNEKQDVISILIWKFYLLKCDLIRKFDDNIFWVNFKF